MNGNVRSLPTAVLATPSDVALLEVKIALIRMAVMAMGAKNFATTTDAERVHDLSWRLGYVASRIEALQERLSVLLPEKPSAPTEQGSAPHA